MKKFNNVNISNNYRGSALAIGNFDGMHKGHQKVFKEARKIAKKNKIKFGVLTFSPLPVMFFNKKIRNYRLALEGQKIKLFERYGADFIVNAKFNKKFSKISAESFIKNIIFRKINPKLIFVSSNFKFGYKRRGNVNLLKNFSKKFNYKLIKIIPYKSYRKIISSTRIRKCLQSGNINLANKLLSRTWFIDGNVKKGKRLGRKLGYRTCNIYIKKYMLPRFGIYAVKVSIENSNKLYKGVAYLGSRPTFSGKEILLEANIFDIKRNLYKKKIKSVFP